MVADMQAQQRHREERRQHTSDQGTQITTLQAQLADMTRLNSASEDRERKLRLLCMEQRTQHLVAQDSRIDSLQAQLAGMTLMHNASEDRERKLQVLATRSSAHAPAGGALELRAVSAAGPCSTWACARLPPGCMPPSHDKAVHRVRSAAYSSVRLQQAELGGAARPRR